MIEEAKQGTIEYWAQHGPEKIGIIEGEEALTFYEWNRQANRIAIVSACSISVFLPA